MSTLTCFDCMKSIDNWEYKMEPVDVPYANLFFHTDCHRKIISNQNILKYIKENIDKIYPYNEMRKKKPKKENKNEELELSNDGDDEITIS